MASHFYGSVQGQTGEATRMGSKKSGIVGWVQNTTGRLKVGLDHTGYGDEGDTASFAVDASTINYGGQRVLSVAFDIDAVMDAGTWDPTTQNALRAIERDFKRLHVAARKAMERKRRLAERAAAKVKA